MCPVQIPKPGHQALFWWCCRSKNHGRPRIIGFEIFAECRLIKKKISRLTWNVLVVRLISIHLNVQTWLHSNTDDRKSFTDLMSSFQFYLSCVVLFSALYFWIFCMGVSFFYLLFFVNVYLKVNFVLILHFSSVVVTVLTVKINIIIGQTLT